MKPSIEILERSVWPEPIDATGLVRRAHVLRKKPIDELTVDELRTAFRQDIGVQFLKERVVEVLAAQPDAGELYEGDLILSVLESRLFKEDAEFRSKVLPIATQALDRDIDKEVRKAVMQTKAAEPGATDNPDGAQRLREDH